MYGSSVPPPPPILNGGQVPSRRITTQPQQEMPSCVQNAMMTKDKKPFTYTPGGIDLSQIKSPRMAQRISRNANMEGVTNQPKPSPLAQQNTNMSTPVAPSLPASAFGMPIQVFPSGPPPPPPAPNKSQLNSNVNANGNGNRSPSMQRKSPQPQTFEPPPFHCRPKIDIPPNPMANLRKVPTPKPKEANWVEEYRKERSKSPMPNVNESDASTQETQTQLPDTLEQTNKQMPDKVDSPTNTVPQQSVLPQQSAIPRQASLKESENTQTDQNNNNNNGNNFNASPQQRVFSPFASSPQPNLPKPLSPVKLNQDENVPIYVRSSQSATSPKPPTPQQECGQTSPVSTFQRQPSLEQTQTPVYTRTANNVSASPVKQLNQSNNNVCSSPVKQFNQSTFNQSNNVCASPVKQFNQPPLNQSNNVCTSPVKQINQPSNNKNDSETENHPIYARSYQKPQAPAVPTQSQPQASQPQASQPQASQPQASQPQASQPQASQSPASIQQQPLSTAQPFISEPGRQYHQSNRANNPQQMLPWMRRTNSKELPEWANNEDVNVNRPTAPQYNQSSTFSANSNYPTNGSTTQYGYNGPNAVGQKERVVPVQFGQTPNKAPTSSGFTAQPYQSTPPQYRNVQPPPFAPTASNYASTYNDPHKFVDQGYNNVQNWDISQHAAPPKSNDGTRIIPIKLEDGHPYLNNGPVSQLPHVIQSDNRSTPNQSKSFRVLQQITDTMKTDPNESNALKKPAELHQPHYSRPLGPNDMNEHQLRKLKLNEDASKKQSFESRFQQQFPDWTPCKPYSVLQSVMRPGNDADVQVLDTVQNDHLNSISHINNSLSDIPYTVSLPPDIPLHSDYEDSIAETVPLRNDDIYESCIYDSYYNKSPPKSHSISTHSDTVTILPRIVITPTPEDNEIRRASLINYENLTERMAKQSETFEKLTSKPNQIHLNEQQPADNGKDNKIVEYKSFGDVNQTLNNEEITLANFTNNKIHQNSEKLDSSQLESETKTEHNEKYDENVHEAFEYKRNDSLYEIEDIQESEFHSDDESADIIEFIIDNSGDAISNCDTVELNDHMSIIFEEDEHSHNKRVKLDSICSSNSSATLANEDNDSKHFDSEAEEEEKEEKEEKEEEEEEEDSSTVESESDSDNEDDQSTSITVRLPLRLSFSRSSNDEEITTVMVGKSEIQHIDNSLSLKTPILKDSLPDVSVSFSLPPRRRSLYSQQSSVDTANNKMIFDCDNNKSDSEVSVTVSLPLQNNTISPAPLNYRPGFIRQQTLSPVPCSRNEFEYKRWNRGHSVDRTTNIPQPKKFIRIPRDENTIKYDANIKDIISNDNESHSNSKMYNLYNKMCDSCAKVSAKEDNTPANNVAADNIKPENLSVRAKIAAFETIPINRKDDFQRQNALLTSFDEPNEQENIDNRDDLKLEEDNKYKIDYKCDQIKKNDDESSKYEIEYQKNNENKVNYEFNQSIHMNSLHNKPQMSMKNYLNYTEFDTQSTNTPNTSCYVSNECSTVQPTMKFVESQQEHPYKGHIEYAQQHSGNSDKSIEGAQDSEKNYKANLSVSQKIAAFEQSSSSSCPVAKVDTRREITVARESNNADSIGNRFLAKVNEAEIQNTNASQAKKICESKSNDELQTKQLNRNIKLSKMNLGQRSTHDESELEETDSGVDIHRQISEEIDTESECYSELRKLSRYQRAQTHSRLFKILQEYEIEMNDIEKSKIDEEILPLNRPKKIVHNVSITRKQNPELIKQAETMAERRERLHLNHNNSSIDADNPSSSASPSCLSPTSSSVNEKLIDELVQSVLQQTKRGNLRNIPIEKIQAAARRAWIQQQDENDSCDTYSSFDSTPALTPQEFHDDYYDSDADRNIDIFPSKAFKHLQEQSMYGRKNKLWAARCPRVLSSKTVNSDLSRVTETRESQTPERDQQYAYN